MSNTTSQQVLHTQLRHSQARPSLVPAAAPPVGVRRLLELAVKLVIGSVLFILGGVLLAAWRPDLLMLIWNFVN